MRYTRILFIGRDNSTLGPFAESIFKSIWHDERVEIISRGRVVLFEAPVNPKIEVVLGSHDIPLTCSVTKPLTEEDFDRNTLVLTMNEDQRQEFFEAYPLIDVAVLSDYVGEAEIEDPYGGTLMDYENCFVRLSVILKKLALKLEEINAEDEGFDLSEV